MKKELKIVYTLIKDYDVNNHKTTFKLVELKAHAIENDDAVVYVNLNEQKDVILSYRENNYNLKLSKKHQIIDIKTGLLICCESSKEKTFNAYNNLKEKVIKVRNSETYLYNIDRYNRLLNDINNNLKTF